MNRLTTDTPQENYEALMNYAKVKDGKTILSYANDTKDIDLCEYIAHHAQHICGINSQDVMDGACLECDDTSCSLGRAYISSVQAAELRARLKVFEDIEDKKHTFQKPVVQQLAGQDSEFPVEMSCPNCFQPIIIVEAWKKLNYKPRFCYECGQAFDWSGI